MARRDFGPAATRRSTVRPRRGGGLFTGLLAGLLLGIIVAAVVAWFISRDKSEAPKVSQVDDVLPPSKPAKPANSKPPVIKPPSPKPPSIQLQPTPVPAMTAVAKPPAHTAPAAPVQALPPPMDYDYIKILKGEQLKPRAPARPQEQWWLQVAALKNENDARRLRAKLLLLNLDAAVQRAEVGNVLVYRVRVGPFRSEDDSIASLEILSQNNYTPRALKETVLP